MTTHVTIETVSDDNGKSLFRSQRIKLSGKQAVTPFRAIDPSKLRTDVSLNSSAFGFNEIYKSIDSGRLAVLQKDSTELDKFSRAMLNLSKRGHSGDIGICLMKFDSKKANPFPTAKEIELLTDVAHSYSDMTPIPILEAKIDTSNFQNFINYVEKSYDTIEELNQKPIMGALPNLPREFYPKLLDYYLKKGINAFYYDFNGQTPDHLKLRPILRHLKNKKALADTLIYGVNAKPGRTLKNTNIIPSKDFIAYGFGVDVLGGSHIGMKMPKAFFEKMKKAIDAQQLNKKRVFIKSDYGYYKTNAKKDLEQVYPSDTKISLDKIINDTQKTWQNLFNMEQQAIEAAKIRKRLGELKSSETILDYIKEKAQIQKEIKHLQLGPKGLT
ncbi:MAG: hypothetical protein QXI71_04435 [Candidatus Bathyarchaeia archaeon]